MEEVNEEELEDEFVELVDVMMGGGTVEIGNDEGCVGVMYGREDWEED